MRVEAANLEGGPRFEHIALDDGPSEEGASTTAAEVKNASMAAADPSVVAYMGPYNSGAAAHSIPIAAQAGLAQLCPTCTWPGLTQAGWEAGGRAIAREGAPPAFFRMMPADSEQARAAAEWVVVSAADTILVLADGSTYSDAMAREFTAAVGRRPVVEALSFEGRVALGTLSGKVHGDRPRALFYAPSTLGQALALATALASLSYRGDVFVTDVALSEQSLEAPGLSFENWHILFNGSSWVPATESARAWSRQFTARTGKPPTQFAANAYDAANIVVEAARAGSAPGRGAVLTGLQGGRAFDGLNGPVRFNESGDRSGGELTGYVVHAGRFVADWRYTVPTTAP